MNCFTDIFSESFTDDNVITVSDYEADKVKTVAGDNEYINLSSECTFPADSKLHGIL